MYLRLRWHQIEGKCRMKIKGRKKKERSEIRERRGRWGRTKTEMYKYALENWSRTNTHSLHCTKKRGGRRKTSKNISSLAFLSRRLILFLCLLVWFMLSSGAELSHCEQRGNQSLFTNQLSSVPGWREDTIPVCQVDWHVHPHTCARTHTLSHRDPSGLPHQPQSLKHNHS